MMTPDELRHRWKDDVGRQVKKAVDEFFFPSASRTAESPVEVLIVALRSLPGSGEVADFRDLRGTVLAGAIRNADLRFFDFSFSNVDVRFIDCDLSQAVFDSAEVLGSFSGTMNCASFREASIGSSFWHESTLARNCCFENARFQATQLGGVDLSESNLREIQAIGVHLVGANLKGVNLSGAKLVETTLQGTIVDESTDLSSATLENVFVDEIRDRFGRLVARRADLSRARTNEGTVIKAYNPNA